VIRAAQMAARAPRGSPPRRPRLPRSEGRFGARSGPIPSERLNRECRRGVDYRAVPPGGHSRRLGCRGQGGRTCTSRRSCCSASASGARVAMPVIEMPIRHPPLRSAVTVRPTVGRDENSRFLVATVAAARWVTYENPRLQATRHEDRSCPARSCPAASAEAACVVLVGVSAAPPQTRVLGRRAPNYPARRVLPVQEARVGTWLVTGGLARPSTRRAWRSPTTSAHTCTSE
jgi:hypothetical protein